MDAIRHWFSLEGRVTRAEYLTAGILLMCLKYATDAGAIYAVTGDVFTPVNYVLPLASLHLDAVHDIHWLAYVLVGWSLPFIWVGVSMTMRRALDAGLSPWLALLFFVPFVNWLLLLCLAAAPSREAETPDPKSTRDVSAMKSALVGMGVGVVFACAMLLIAVYVLEEYGTALFLGTPFVQGLVVGYSFNVAAKRSVSASVAVVTVSCLLVAGVILMFALEGIVCLSMAFPLAWVGALLGMLVGRSMAEAHQKASTVAAPMLVLPLLALVEPPPVAPQTTVTSTIDIEAPPEVVWEHVVSFSELPPPHRAIFETGVAFPQRARIDGEGPGAVRHCEFSTGAFVEPITTWDEPRHLGFDVVEQPPPMQEWSPFRPIHPPHLDGYFRSVKGEFRLVETSTGTRLEGTTWYELDLHPRPYWSLFADELIGTIHRRVLEHIKTLSET